MDILYWGLLFMAIIVAAIFFSEFMVSIKRRNRDDDRLD